MKREELVRLAGEQALLQKEAFDLEESIERGIDAIGKLHKHLEAERPETLAKSDWSAPALAQIRKLQQEIARIVVVNEEVQALSKKTGL